MNADKKNKNNNQPRRRIPRTITITRLVIITRRSPTTITRIRALTRTIITRTRTLAIRRRRT